MRMRKWILQDWPANVGRPECQLLLAWFRLAQWAAGHWGAIARLVVAPYWLTSSLLLGVELPVTATVGPTGQAFVTGRPVDRRRAWGNARGQRGGQGESGQSAGDLH